MANKKSKKEVVAYEPPAKDDEELHLEKLVFGDVNGFEQNLKQIDNLYDDDYEESGLNAEGQIKDDLLFTYDDSSDDQYDEFLDDMSKKNRKSEIESDLDQEGSGNNDDDEEEEMGDVNDDQLFFHDDSEEEGNDHVEKMDVDSESDEDEGSEDEDSSDEDAWADSEDENLNITLMNTNRTKKLRKSYSENVISGKAYVQRLRAQFEKIYPKPEWADKFEEDENENDDNSDNEEGDDEDQDEHTSDVVKDQGKTSVKNSSNPLLEFLSTNQLYKITDSNTKMLPSNKIDISRLTDANHKHVAKSAIQSLSFHHSHPLLLTGGYDRSLRIYHIDGKINKMITSLFLKKSPVQSAYFNPRIEDNDNSNMESAETTQIMAGGRRRYMYKWDVTQSQVEKISRLYGHEQSQRSFEYFKLSPNGKYILLRGNSGWINVLDSKTSQWVKGFKIEGTLIDFDVSYDKTNPVLIAVNTSGEVWEWELESEKILSRWTDESGIGITKIRIGGTKNSRWLAIGTNNGIVNVYDRLSAAGHKKPYGTIENLVTTISSIEFTSDGQMLCIASRDKKDALKLVHLPSCRTFANWPTSGTPLGKVTSCCFSPNNEMLAVGNEAGKVRLFKLNHY